MPKRLIWREIEGDFWVLRISKFTFLQYFGELFEHNSNYLDNCLLWPRLDIVSFNLGIEGRGV